MTGLPSGTATFLFTDIEGSTKLVHELGDSYDDLLEIHRRLLRDAFAAHGGHEIGTEGDSFFVVFARATDALRAAVEGQIALTTHEWPAGNAIRVRMGMHTGEARVVANDYVGMAVHQAARVSSAANGGQILISEATKALVQSALPEGVALLDLGHHHLKDIPTAENLFQVEHPDLPNEFAPIRSLDVRRHNLPTQLTTFIGRESEITDLRKLIATNRLVTLTGAGGCGKTRLALEVAADVMTDFTNGIRLVDLAPVTGPEAVAQATANALGLREQEGRTIDTALGDYLAMKQMLLILDNCEHLVRPAADLAEHLLKNTTELRILVTTREPLGIDGEVAWRVPSLEVPDPKQRVEIDELHGCQAVRLFIDRAASADPTFAPSNDDIRAIAEICHRLDGIPLAIELAAARTDVLTPSQIAERLHDRFRLLTGGRRTALARQQTLQALVDWSYDLLEPVEQTLLERVSVFAGSFTLDAAEHVCADEESSPHDVLDLLSQLVKKSLLSVSKVGPSARYRMLETVKQYGRDKLFASPLAAAIRTRHRDHYLDLAERTEPDLAGPNQKTALDAIEADHDNLRAALEWSCADEDPTLAIRLSYALWQFWFIRGHWSEASRWYEQILELDGAPSDALRARLLSAAAYFAAMRHDVEAVDHLVEECLRLADATGDTLTRGYAQWSRHFARSIRTEETRPCVAEALTIARSHGDDRLAAWCLMVQGSDTTTDPDERDRLQTEALEVARRAGDLWNAAMATHNLGTFAYHRGEIERGEDLAVQALDIWRQLGDTSLGLAQTLQVLGLISLAMGDRPSAIAYLYECRDVSGDLGDPQALLSAVNALAWVLHESGEDERALPEALEGARLVSTIESLAQFRAQIMHTLGEIQRALGDVDSAKRTLVDALSSAEDDGTRAACLEGLAGVALSEGRLDDAAKAFGAGEAVRARSGAEREAVAIYERDVTALTELMAADAMRKSWDEGREKADEVASSTLQNG